MSTGGPPVSASEVLALAREDFGAFCSAMYPRFQFPPHLQLLASKLEAVLRGDLKRLIVQMPPRHGKSHLASTYFPAFMLGSFPEKSIIFATYSEELSGDFGRRVRNIVTDPLFAAIFPDCELSPDALAAHRITTRQGGGFVATGRGGALTGRGCDLLLLDDLMKDAEEGRSESVRRSVREFYETTAFTRLQPNGAVVLIGTRWAVSDLIGTVLEEHADESWEVINLPAVAVEDEPPPLSRRRGEPLWPERFSVEALAEIRSVLGSAAFETLYQGSPVSAEGQTFKRAWWRYYEPSTPPSFTRITISLDTAFQAKKTADYSAATVWGDAPAGYFLLDAWRGRVEFPELKRRVVSLAERFRPHSVLIEDAASGQSLAQELQAGTRLSILPIKVTGDKIARAAAVSPIVESGRVYLPNGVGWLDDFLTEVSTFPLSKHDDFVDTLTQFLNWARGRSSGPWQFALADEAMGQRAREWAAAGW